MSFRSLVVSVVLLVLSAVPALGAENGIIESPAYGSWNGFFNHYPVIECLNLRDSGADLQITVLRDSGETIGSVSAHLDSRATYHLPLTQFRDATGRGIQDSYGLYRITTSAGAKISCFTANYRMSSVNPDVPNYAFALPVSKPLRGRSFGLYNSIDPGSGTTPTENWLTIFNPSSVDFAAELRIYDGQGAELSRRSVVVSPNGRRDFGLGHDRGQVTGMYEILPASESAPYGSFLARYNRLSPTEFSFAFAISSMQGACGDTLPVSTMVNATNWLELGNPHTNATTATVSIRDSSGAIIHQETIWLPERSQHHVYINQYLSPSGQGNLGSVTIDCDAQRALIAQSAFYGHDESGQRNVTWAYMSQALGAPRADTGEALVGSANVFFGAANWLKLAQNGGERSLEAVNILNTRGRPVAVAQSTLNAGGTRDIDVHSPLTAAHELLGSIEVSADTLDRALSGELIRVFYRPTAGGPRVAAIMPTPVAIVAGKVQVESSSVIVEKNSLANFSLHGSDADSRAIRYDIVNYPEHGELLGENGDLIYVPNIGYVGEDRFRFRASAGSNASPAAEVSFSVVPSSLVPPANTAPQLSFSGELTIRDNETATLNPVIVHDGSPNALLGYRWSVVSGPGVVTFSPARSPSPQISFSHYGFYRLRLRVTDGWASSADEIVVRVMATSGACADGSDNDSDGAKDMYDFACQEGEANEASRVAQCQDGVDNDGNGFVDLNGGTGTFAPSFADSGCESFQDNDESNQNCNDGIDNDHDGWSDAADPDCENSNSTEGMVALAQCSDGIDNDGDGLTDRADADCSSALDNDEGSGPTHPACADGVDNDADGLTDFPFDPGCAAPDDSSENSESRGSGAHNFNFSFNTFDYPGVVNPDTEKRFNVVDWNGPDGVRRVIWDDYTRLIPHPAAYKVFFHSVPGQQPRPEAWTIKLANGSALERQHADLTYTKIRHEADRATFKIDDARASDRPGALEVVDDLRFVGDTIYVTVNITNHQAEKVNVSVPFHLGSLLVGNVNPTSRILEWADPQVQKLVPESGGRIDDDCCGPASARIFDYPMQIGSFAPVLSLWGRNSSSFTIGAQLLSDVDWPNNVGMRSTVSFDHTMDFLIHAEIRPNSSHSVILAFTFSRAGDWQSSIVPYKNWYNYRFGKGSRATGEYSPTPGYCPMTGFTYTVGNSTTYYNQSTLRYQTNYQNRPPTLTNMLTSSTQMTTMSRLGLEWMGFWQYALDSQYTSLNGRFEYTGMIDLLDPAIGNGQGNPLEQLPALAQAWASSNPSTPRHLFWFARPSLAVYGAEVIYKPDGSYDILRGKTNWVDLRNYASRERALRQLDEFVRRGVDGFYSDAGGAPGQYAFFNYAEKVFQQRYNKHVTIIEEGAVARNATRRPQIPIIKSAGAHSLLINYLTPMSTYHGGYINDILSDAEIDYILARGYQIIPGGGLNQTTAKRCQWANGSAANEHQHWVDYGAALGCTEPISTPLPDCPTS